MKAWEREGRQGEEEAWYSIAYLVTPLFLVREGLIPKHLWGIKSRHQ